VAIDANPNQNHLLRLKMKALQRLEYTDYAAFIGLFPGSERSRLAVLGELSKDLPEETRPWIWRGREAILRGILYQGRWERFYRLVSKLAHLMRGRAIDRLFSFNELEEQRRFVREQWDCFWWRRTFDLLCSTGVSRWFLGDPAYYAHVDVSVGQFLYGRMKASLERTLARNNFMLSLVFRGRLSEEDLPPHLTPAGFETIRGRLDRIRIETRDLISYVEAEDSPCFSRFSLSDVPSFLTQGSFARLLHALPRRASPAARGVIRQFLTRQRVPAELGDRLIRDRGLEARLAEEDRAFAYDFIVGEVQRG
jgi:S-adenosylmethionine-diacylglycerol 3-amino-3-carboxypropyl transferase